MDAATLHRIVPSADLARCAALLPGYNWCCRIIGANTVERCAMLLAMVAEESASFHATEEYASGAEYNWRRDLGNVRAGDGERFKGRSLIQITGRNNYGRISQWAHRRGLVPTPTYFLDHPAKLADMQYAWVGPAQYWDGDHNHGYGSINAAADARDLVAATYMVNGGQNGIDTRRLYWQRALAQGTAILPAKPVPAAPFDQLMEQIMSWYKTQAEFEAAVAAAAGRGVMNATVPLAGEVNGHKVKPAKLSRVLAVWHNALISK